MADPRRRDTPTGRSENEDDLAALFGLEDEDQPEKKDSDPVGGVLPEPLVITEAHAPKQPRALVDDPIGAEGGGSVLEKMRSGVEAAGMEISYEARVGSAGDKDADWYETIDHYLGVLQRKSSEDGATGLGLKLTSDPEQEKRDRGKIANLIGEAFLQRDPGMGEAMFGRLVAALYNEVVGLSILAPLWRDPSVTEILVDGWDEIYYEKGGRLYPTDLKFRSKRHLETISRNLAEAVSDRALSKSTPLVTARLPHARVAFVYGDVAGEAVSYITIRKHHDKLTWDDLMANNTMTPEMRDFLAECVRARVNILISGGTGAGKTTVINAVSAFIPDDERVITIEDSYELELRNRYWVKLQAKEKASADDQVSVTVSDLLRQTLRMRPDRIVVGEVRDGAAAAALLEASNTGHDGTLTTLHANSDWDAINARLPALYQTFLKSSLDVARSEVSRAFELVVHITRRKGRRYVSAISEVGAMDMIRGEITIRKLYEGRIDADGNVGFVHLAHPDADGDLARKFDDAAIPMTVGNLTPAGSAVRSDETAPETPVNTEKNSETEAVVEGWAEMWGADATDDRSESGDET